MATYRLLGLFREEGGSIGQAGQQKLRYDQRQAQVGGQVAEGVTLEALRERRQTSH